MAQNRLATLCLNSPLSQTEDHVYNICIYRFFREYGSWPCCGLNSRVDMDLLYWLETTLRDEIMNSRQWNGKRKLFQHFSLECQVISIIRKSNKWH